MAVVSLSKVIFVPVDEWRRHHVFFGNLTMSTIVKGHSQSKTTAPRRGNSPGSNWLSRPVYPLVEVRVAHLGVGYRKGTLVTRALGSCVAVCAYDGVNKIAGLLHALLPASKGGSARTAELPTTFVDQGIVALIANMRKAGATMGTTRIKLVGGASVMATKSSFNIGKRNVLTARKILWSKKLPIDAEEVGGNVARTVWMDVATGVVMVQIPGRKGKRL